MTNNEIITELDSIIEHMCDDCAHECKKCRKNIALHEAIYIIEHYD